MDSREIETESGRLFITDYLIDALKLDRRNHAALAQIFAADSIGRVRESAVNKFTDYFSSLHEKIADHLSQIQDPTLNVQTIAELKNIYELALVDYANSIELKKIYEQVGVLDDEKEAIEKNLKISFLHEAFERAKNLYPTQSKEYQALEILIKLNPEMARYHQEIPEVIQSEIIKRWTNGSVPNTFFAGIKTLQEFTKPVSQLDETTFNHAVKTIADAFSAIKKAKEYAYLGAMGKNYVQQLATDVIKNFASMDEKKRPDKNNIILAVARGAEILNVKIDHPVAQDLVAKDNLKKQAKPKFFEKLRRKEGPAKEGFFRRISARLRGERASEPQAPKPVKK